METCEQQILMSFEAESLSSPPASLASRLPSPASEAAAAITVGSGRQCAMWLAESSPLGSFSKILLESSAWTASKAFCYAWKALDTPFALSAFQLTLLEPRTSDTESSLLATPQAHDHKSGNPKRISRFGTQHGGRNLNDQIACLLLPTPDAKLHKSGVDSLRSSRGASGGDDLLSRLHKLLPTPAHRDYRAPNQLPFKARHPGSKRGEQLPNFLGGLLSPRFVEQIMGFPTEHSASAPSVTP